MKFAYCFFVALLAQGCGVELLVEEVDVPAQACPEQDLADDSFLSVINVGDEDSSQFNIAWYLSDDDVFDSSDALMLGGRDQVSGLAAQSSVSVSLGQNIIPPSAALGPQYLLTVVDELDQVEEVEETNNVVASPIEIIPCSGGCTGTVPATGSDERVEALVVADSGEIYIAGSRSMDSFAADDVDGFLRKLDATGTSVIWDRPLDHCFWDSATDLALTPGGDVVVVGSTRTGPFASTEANFYIRKYNPAGALLWESFAPANLFSSNLFSVSVDALSEEIVATGPATLDAGEPFQTLVVRFAANGSLIFSVTEDLGSGSMGMAVDVYGDFSGVVGRASGAQFVAGFDGAGSVTWLEDLGSSSNAPGHNYFDALVDSTGGFYALTRADSTSGSTAIRAPQIARYDFTGNQEWLVTPAVPGPRENLREPVGFEFLGNTILVGGIATTFSGAFPFLLQLADDGTTITTQISSTPGDLSLTDFAINTPSSSAYFSGQESTGALGTPTYSRVVIEPLEAVEGIDLSTVSDGSD